MTGKEALIHVSKGLSALAFEEGKWKIHKNDNEALQALRVIVQEHDKYKRAFDILKEKFELHIEKNSEEFWCEYYSVDNQCMNLTKEEYELLEELMKDV